MIWSEELPKQCPPNNAIPPNGIYYRILKNKTLCVEDFLSHKLLFPTHDYSDNECIARSLSLDSNYESLVRVFKSIPRLRNTGCIAQINLQTKDGLILETPSQANKNHISWWVSTDFQISQWTTIA